MIDQNDWPPARYDEWFASLTTRPTPKSKRSGRFEIKYTGENNYLLAGGGQQFWADGIEACTVLEVKLALGFGRSPFVQASGIPDIVRDKIVAKVRDEFRRIGVIIADEGNPLTRVRVITNEPRAIPFFTALMEEFGLVGEVIVRPE